MSSALLTNVKKLSERVLQVNVREPPYNLLIRMKDSHNAWKVAFVVVALGVLMLKLLLAFSTRGAADISVWKDFVVHINECGVCVYHTGGLMQYPGGTRVNPFNHPPFIIHLLKFVNVLSLQTGLAFETVFRSLTSLVDVGTAVVAYHILRREQIFSSQAFVLYLLAPATIVISGYHGNTDTVMIFLVLLAALLISTPWLAGVAFGMALNIKVVPIVFLFTFVQKCEGGRKKLWFLGMTLLVVLVASLPFLFQDPVAIAKGVLGYRGFTGRWGLSRALFASLGPSELYQTVTRLSTYLLLAFIFYLSWRSKTRPLIVSLGLLAFIFIAFTPAWGTNYMAWLDPFAIALGPGPALAYYLTSGAMLGYLYFVNDDESTRLISISWMVVLLLTWLFIKRIKQLQRSNHEGPDRP